MVNGKGPVLPLDSFLFPRIFQAFRMSIQPTKLILAFGAVATICLAGRVMDAVSNSVVVAPSGETELDEYVTEGQVLEHIRLFRADGTRTGVYTTLWNYGAKQFHEALYGIFDPNTPKVVEVYEVVGPDTPRIVQSLGNCISALAWAFSYHPYYSVVFFALALAIISLTGGAICRIAALQFAKGEKPGLTEATRFGVRKFTSLLTAPVTPAVIIAVIGAFIVALGFWGNIPIIGELSVGVFLPLAFIAAAIVAIIAIGTVAGFSLMFPTIAYEDSDCFDAISRSFSYVYAKPWRMGFYCLIAFVYGAVCYIFVRFFCFLLLRLTHLFLQVGFLWRNEKLDAMWPVPTFPDFLGSANATPPNWSTSLGAFLVHAWVLVVVGLMVSFVISFYFSASTIIYALMRNRVDRIALDEIYTAVDEMEETSAPARVTASDEPGETPDASPDGTPQTSE
jgi:hypothetical protein